MSQENNIQGAPVDQAAELARMVEEAQKEKVIEEVKQLKKTTAKTDVEIEKLRAELKQLTQPFRSPQFYFSLISALAALGAIGGILIQSNWRELQSQIQEQKIDAKEKELKAKLKEFGEAKKQFEDQLKKANEALTTANEARKQEEKILARYSALAKVVIAPLNNEGMAESVSPTYGKVIDSLARDAEDYFFLVAILDGKPSDAKTLAALVLSRLDKKNIDPPDRRAELAKSLLSTLLAEDDLRRKRLVIKAIGKLGRHAVPVLAAKVGSVTDESRLNLIRALGEAGSDDPPAALKALNPFLESENKTLLRQVVWSLGMIGPAAHDAEQPLVKLLPAPSKGLLVDSENYLLCKEIISSLGKIGIKNQQSVPPLVRFFELDDSKADDLRTELLIAFSRVDADAKEAAPKILEIIKREKRTPVLNQAAIALGRIGAKNELVELLHAEEKDKARVCGYRPALSKKQGQIGINSPKGCLCAVIYLSCC